MKKTAVVLLTLLLAIAGIGGPILLAIEESQRQAFKAESAHALGYARDVVMRGDETAGQVAAAVKRLCRVEAGSQAEFAAMARTISSWSTARSALWMDNCRVVPETARMTITVSRGGQSGSAQESSLTVILSSGLSCSKSRDHCFRRRACEMIADPLRASGLFMPCPSALPARPMCRKAREWAFAACPCRSARYVSNDLDPASAPGG